MGDDRDDLRAELLARLRDELGLERMIVVGVTRDKLKNPRFAPIEFHYSQDNAELPYFSSRVMNAVIRAVYEELCMERDLLETMKDKDITEEEAVRALEAFKDYLDYLEEDKVASEEYTLLEAEHEEMHGERGPALPGRRTLRADNLIEFPMLGDN